MNLIKLFFPGMWLMRRMRMATKLGVLALVALVPLLIVQGQLLQHQHDALAQTRGALQGVGGVAELATVVRHVQTHRGQTNMVLSGNESAKAGRDKTREALATAAQRAGASLSQVQNPTLATAWDALAARVQGLAGAMEGKSAPESFALHSALVEDLQRFSQSLAKESGLLFESDPVLGLLVHMAVTQVTPWTEQLGRLRGQGAGLLSQGAPSPVGSARLLTQVDALESVLRDLEHMQAQMAQGGIRDAAGDKALAASRDFASLVRTRFAPEAPAEDPQAYFAAGTAAIEAVGQYQTGAMESLAQRLQARNARISQTYWLDVAVSAVGVSLLVYFMLAFRLSFMADLQQVLRFMQQMAQGNLRHRARVRGSDELNDMSDVMDNMVDSFSSMVASVRSNAALVSQSGVSLVGGSHALSDRTEQQAANLEQTNASVQELASTVQGNAHAAQESDRGAREVRTIADQSAQRMQQAVAQIEAIQAGTRRMDEIVGVIDGLAFQTNILALNAAVEAARAGESGRGFAVVASEVRSLAQRSASSAKEIRELISASSSQVGKGVDLIRDAGAQMDAVVQGIRTVAAKMSEISTSSAEQSTSLAEISAAVRQLDEITQQNAAMVETAAQQASELQNQASTLAASVSVFQLQQGTADEALALVEKALAHRRRVSSREAFVRDITAPEQGFFDRDMYVFVLDRGGAYLSFGGNLAKVGTHVQDIPGVDGQGLVNDIIAQAESAPGWVQYDITNPSTGKVQTKMSYVCRVDDLYLGCGVYKNLAA